MYLWLDDARDPNQQGTKGYTWCRTFQEATDLLRTGNVLFASIDHDLSLEAAAGSPRANEPNGFNLIEFMELHHLWPRDGVVVHAGRREDCQRMHEAIARHYGQVEFAMRKAMEEGRVTQPASKYPSIRYSAAGRTLMVLNEVEDEKALDSGWAKSPADHRKPKVEPEHVDLPQPSDVTVHVDPTGTVTVPKPEVKKFGRR